MTTTPRASQPAANGRLSNIISKITSPFSPKVRTFSDFYITTTEDPRPRYAPEDNVQGWVNLVMTKPTRITHITVVFHGYAKVYRHAAAPGEGNPVEAALLKGTTSVGNGSVVIFERESVVCGDGRLSPGRYKFGFNFKFPKGPLPSSIDFERGTISYVVSAALTRPTTIAPTVLCDKKVELVETIDISNASLCNPKQRAVSMKPIMKKKTKANKSIQTDPKPSSIAPSQSTRPPSPQADRAGAHSPTVSEFSTHSGVTSSDNSNPMQIVTVETAEGSQGRNSLNTMNDDAKVITATVDLLRSGYLPGDTIPIKISVKHTKHIQSMRGIIVTLYRKARVDPRTERSLQKTKSKGDYVPKSRTAFGGLTFATPRADHTFRMDLNQNFAPLITNPNTLTAEVKTTVTVPDDIFPSITSVPEQMIQFTYHLEVIMDLNCKLAGLDRVLPRISITNNPSNPTLNQAAGQDRAHGHLNQFFDTAAIRRRDSIPDCCFDITIGTKDGQRKPAKRPFDPWDKAVAVQTPPQEESPQLNDNILVLDSPPPPLLDNETPRAPLPQPITPIPLPEPEEQVDEKTRLRRAEERFLPSAPPSDYASSSITPLPSAPSAPTFDHFAGNGYHPPSAPAYHGPSAPPFEAINGLAPPPNDLARPSSAGPSSSAATPADPADDKQELERQRLLAAASAPEYRDEDRSDEPPATPAEAPSAPTLDEEAEYSSRAHGTRSWNGHPPLASHEQESSSSSGRNHTPLVHHAPPDAPYVPLMPHVPHVAADGARGAHDAFGDHDEAELPSYQR